MKKKHLLVFHIIFWIFVIFLNFSFFIFSTQKLSIWFYLNKTVKMANEIAVFYVAYSFLVPKFFQYDKIKRFIMIFAVFSVLLIAVYAIDTTWVEYKLGVEATVKRIKFNIINASYYTNLYLILGTFLRLTFDGIKIYYEKQQLQKQNLQSELALLRSQINPHFLFNTLNNIHSFTHTDADRTSDSIVKLSEIMRYMLYDANKEKVQLSEEINYIKSFLSLQKLRLENPDGIKLDIKGSIDNIQVPPMIFIPFIENAFKHGSKKVAHGMNISFNMLENELEFKCSNAVKDKTSNAISDKGGFGLKNIQRRLDILYPNCHSLEISENKSEYQVLLKLQF